MLAVIYLQEQLHILHTKGLEERKGAQLSKLFLLVSGSPTYLAMMRTSLFMFHNCLIFIDIELQEFLVFFFNEAVFWIMDYFLHKRC